MPKFSNSSLNKLKTCHPDLQRLFKEVVKHVDCTIIEGVRSKEQQAEYVRTGKSRTMNSKHLKQSDGYSWAVDCLAYPLQWNNFQRNYLFAGFVKGVALSLGIKIRMGADWDGDFDTKDQTFYDLPHFELIEASQSSPPSNDPTIDEFLPPEPTESEIDISLADIERSSISND